MTNKKNSRRVIKFNVFFHLQLFNSLAVSWDARSRLGAGQSRRKRHRRLLFFLFFSSSSFFSFLFSFHCQIIQFFCFLICSKSDIDQQKTTTTKMKTSLFYKQVAESSGLLDDLVLIVYAFCDDHEMFSLDYLVPHGAANKKMLRTVGDNWILFEDEQKQVVAYNRKTRTWTAGAILNRVRRLNGHEEPCSVSSSLLVTDSQFSELGVLDLDSLRFRPFEVDINRPYFVFSSLMELTLSRWVVFEVYSRHFYLLEYDLELGTVKNSRLFSCGYFNSGKYCKHHAGAFLYIRKGDDEKEAFWSYDIEQKSNTFVADREKKSLGICYLADRKFVLLSETHLDLYQDDTFQKKIDFNFRLSAWELTMKGSKDLLLLTSQEKSYLVFFKTGIVRPLPGFLRNHCSWLMNNGIVIHSYQEVLCLESTVCFVPVHLLDH